MPINNLFKEEYFGLQIILIFLILLIIFVISPIISMYSALKNQR
jgi:hypothetical protein